HSRVAWTDAVRFPPSARSMVRCGLSILRHTSTHPQCIAPLSRTEGRLFSLKIICRQCPVRNGYAVDVHPSRPVKKSTFDAVLLSRFVSRSVGDGFWHKRTTSRRRFRERPAADGFASDTEDLGHMDIAQAQFAAP